MAVLVGAYDAELGHWLGAWLGHWLGAWLGHWLGVADEYGVAYGVTEPDVGQYVGADVAVCVGRCVGRDARHEAHDGSSLVSPRCMARRLSAEHSSGGWSARHSVSTSHRDVSFPVGSDGSAHTYACLKWPPFGSLQLRSQHHDLSSSVQLHELHDTRFSS